MFRTLMAIGLLSLASIGIDAAPGRASSPGQGSFCPGCWEFVADEWAHDLKGRCSTCGRDPVDLSVISMTWYWCRGTSEWRRQACLESPKTRCCVRRSSNAVLTLSTMEPTMAALYCPHCRVVRPEPTTNCPDCGKPFVAARAVARTWYWCRKEEEWLTEACLSSAACSCCSPRSGHLLAHVILSFCPRVLPTSSSVSVREESPLLVSTEWLEARLAIPGVVVVHVGFSPQATDAAVRDAYESGHIPGARFLPWEAVAKTRRGVPNEFPPLAEMVAAVRRLGISEVDRVVLYDTGNGLEAARAFVAFEYLGLGENVSLLDGHWKLWSGEQRPLELVAPDVEPSYFTPIPRPEVLVSTETLQDYLWLAGRIGGRVVVIDARSPLEFMGFTGGKGVTRAGHIPGAVNLWWCRQIFSSENPTLRPEEELRELFEGVRARPGATLIAYCRTGVQASHTYFTAKYLGYDVKLYDGSYFEWSGRPELEVRTGGPERPVQ